MPSVFFFVLFPPFRKLTLFFLLPLFAGMAFVRELSLLLLEL